VFSPPSNNIMEKRSYRKAQMRAYSEFFFLPVGTRTENGEGKSVKPCGLRQNNVGNNKSLYVRLLMDNPKLYKNKIYMQIM
jgi:hypothetical protein